jgi:hypothetical protein
VDPKRQFTCLLQSAKVGMSNRYMKNLGLVEAITIIANIGVIAGLAFLAFEIRQNTAQMRAEAAYAIHEDVQRMNQSLYGDSALADLLARSDTEYESLGVAE